MKKSLFSGLLALGSLALFVIRKRQTNARYPNGATPVVKSAELIRTENAAHRCMMGLIAPVWIAAGLFDYICHRQTKIETTSGKSESLLHLIMVAEGGPMVLAPLMLEGNAGLLAMLAAVYFLHQATAIWDVDHTVMKRVVSPGEQLVHGYLEGVPFCVAALYMGIHWDQTLALLGLNDERPRFELQWRQPKVPVRDIALMSVAVIAFDVLPHLEEYWRCIKAERRGLAGSDVPACAPILFGDEAPVAAA